jgi:hypothetical protein
MRRGEPPNASGLTAIAGAMALIVVLVVVQIWLLTATLESYLAGHQSVAMPAAAFSGAIFLCCAALYIFVDRVDVQSRR